MPEPAATQAATTRDETSLVRRTFDALADNSLLVLIFCAVGALLFAAFAPDTVVGDTWMTLVSGREIVDYGLPHVDHLTVSAPARRGPTNSGSRTSPCTEASASAAWVS